MTFLVLLFWLIVTATLQALFPTWRHMEHAEFPFLLAVVLYAALNKKGRYCVLTAVVAGILMDSMSLSRLGVSVCGLLAAGGLAMLLRPDFYDDKVHTIMFFGALCASVATGVTALMLRLTGWNVLWPVVGWRILGACILGAMLTPLMFGMIRTFERRLGTLDMGDA